jgi:hypothetical protein
MIGTAPVEPIMIVPKGTATGTPAYFVIDPGTQPWLANDIHDLVANVTMASVIYYASPGGAVDRVSLRAVDDANCDWTVTLASTGDVIDRVVYTDNPANEWEYSLHETRVHGFPPPAEE